MDVVVVQMLPLILGAILAPVWIIIVLLLLASPQGLLEDDPDEPPPQWMQSFAQASPLKALGLGVLLVGIGIKLWVFTLSALSIISGPELGQSERVIAYAIFIGLTQVALIAAILVYAVVPQAASLLKRALDWLTRYNRPISITVGLIFGLYFGYSGISGLLS